MVQKNFIDDDSEEDDEEELEHQGVDHIICKVKLNIKGK